jgi:hypothetical protein
LLNKKSRHFEKECRLFLYGYYSFIFSSKKV